MRSRPRNRLYVPVRDARARRLNAAPTRVVAPLVVAVRALPGAAAVVPHAPGARHRAWRPPTPPFPVASAQRICLTLKEFLGQPAYASRTLLINISVRDWGSDEGVTSETFRAAPRPFGYAVSYVNSAFLARSSVVSADAESGSHLIEDVCLAFGAFGAQHIDLEELPGHAWAVSYFAEIEDLAPNETRKFKLVIPDRQNLAALLGGLIGGLIGGGALASALVVWFVLSRSKLIKLRKDFDDKVGGTRQFKYRDLAAATNQFSDNCKLGEGNFGVVYRGFLSQLDCDVAVKKIKSSAAHKDFFNEVRIINEARHKNLVKLLGCCCRACSWSVLDFMCGWCKGKKDEVFLVYELVKNGDLDYHPHKCDSSQLLGYGLDALVDIDAAALFGGYVIGTEDGTGAFVADGTHLAEAGLRGGAGHGVTDREPYEEAVRREQEDGQGQVGAHHPNQGRKDPQSLVAKNRRKRISERLRILQELVPSGTKVDLVTMLEKAISYVKFLPLQVKVLATDEFWPAQGGKASAIS
ncbi:hypothetical protein ABZP36_008195 [Zizania latifolia]